MKRKQIWKFGAMAAAAITLSTAAAFAQSAPSSPAPPPPPASTPASTPAPNAPREPLRPFVFLNEKAMQDILKKLGHADKVEELIGGPGSQLRVVIQHEGNSPGGAELHDTSDDVYYILDGTATIRLGGHLDQPHEASPGEWKGKAILDGQDFEMRKGDLIIVPRGTPHMRISTGRELSLILMKIYQDPLPAPAPRPQEGKKP